MGILTLWKYFWSLCVYNCTTISWRCLQNTYTIRFVNKHKTVMLGETNCIAQVSYLSIEKDTSKVVKFWKENTKQRSRFKTVTLFLFVDKYVFVHYVNNAN